MSAQRLRALLLIIFFIAAAVYFKENIAALFDRRVPIAKVSDLQNEIKFHRNGSLEIQTAKTGTLLFSGDRLEVGPKSSAVLTFSNDCQIKILTDSQVVIERSESTIPPQSRLTFLIGSYELVHEGDSSSDIVAVMGDETHEVRSHRTPPGGPITVDSKNSQTSTNQSENTAPTTPTTATSPSPALAQETTAGTNQNSGESESQDGLPDPYIAGVVQGQKYNFGKCFAELLQVMPQAQGRVDMSFTIENRGTVSRAKVLGSTIKDEKFQKCLTTVFERILFRGFTGPAIVVNYPLQFE